MSAEITFPRQAARTQRFTFGAPRAFSIAGDTVAFLRSRGGEDRTTCLWTYDVTTGTERLIADPNSILGEGGEELSAAEKARRERAREGAAGIVGYALDSTGSTAAFTLSGRLFAASLETAEVRELDVPGPVIDPRPSPTGTHIAYASGGSLRVINTDGTGDRALAEPDGSEIAWGTAEFIAAEEMSRYRGYWWSPDGASVIATRVDESPVQRWFIADPANPGTPAHEIAYPAAGTPNAEVTAYVISVEDGVRTEITWDREQFPYLVTVHWSGGGAPLLAVQTRDQKTLRTLTVDVTSGATAELHTETDPVWIDITNGVPAWTPDGRLVRLTDREGARRLVVGDSELTDRQIHLRSILDITDTDVLIGASAGVDADDAETGEIHLYSVTTDGARRVSEGQGVHSAVRSGDVAVLLHSSLDHFGPKVTVTHQGKPVGEIVSYAATPVIRAEVELVTVGEPQFNMHGIPCAVFLPTGFDKSSGERLPVLMDPYGGPHGQRVVASQNAHLASQWLADQGFCVVVADGRGTPHYGPAWEKAIRHDFAGATLRDQIDALDALSVHRGYMDTRRVAIRGWSYGGYLAALAMLRRPDIFHAAIAGAPVTDWALYDTHYTERYLGTPQGNPAVYTRNSLVEGGELGLTEEPNRPLMVIHGLADDNVVAAHTLRLSSALLAAGRQHTVLPLSGVTHMTPQEEVAENLLLLQVDFLKKALAAE